MKNEDPKWVLAEIISKQGYDMLTALEMAQKTLDEFKASGRESLQLGVKNEKGKLVGMVKISKVQLLTPEEEECFCKNGQCFNGGVTDEK